MSKLIMLKNDFHNTEVRVRVEGESPWILSKRQSQRIDRGLCGVKGCSCGCIRGSQGVWCSWERFDDPDTLAPVYVWVLEEKGVEKCKE